VIAPLVLLFIVVPIAELAVIIQVGEAIGVWWTIAILVADSILGSVLLRVQGRAAWRRFVDSLRSGRVPAREVLDGGLVLFGGVLLLTPGFISDVLGILLLLPPTRAAARHLLSRRFERHLTGPPRGPRERRQPPPDVEGTAVEVDPGALPRERPAR
jgi:UPF0716 protein FxsA